MWQKHKKFNHAKGFNQHFYFSHREKNFKCKKCTRYFPHKFILKSHIEKCKVEKKVSQTSIQEMKDKEYTVDVTVNESKEKSKEKSKSTKAKQLKRKFVDFWTSAQFWWLLEWFFNLQQNLFTIIKSQNPWKNSYKRNNHINAILARKLLVEGSEIPWDNSCTIAFSVAIWPKSTSMKVSDCT